MNIFKRIFKRIFRRKPKTSPPPVAAPRQAVSASSPSAPSHCDYWANPLHPASPLFLPSPSAPNDRDAIVDQIRHEIGGGTSRVMSLKEYANFCEQDPTPAPYPSPRSWSPPSYDSGSSSSYDSGSSSCDSGGSCGGGGFD